MSHLDELTNQERNVLALVAKGWRNLAIANELSISTKTVETHLSHIFNKLCVSSRTEAALIVLQNTPKIRENSHDKEEKISYPSTIN
ncbi:MAG: LuxR C-terminal-related transcriptional regulator [Chloroflexota bacterium]